jgi:hypothetical protein
MSRSPLVIAAMPEVRLPFGAVWLMACYSRMELTIFRPSRAKEGLRIITIFPA